MRVKCELEKVTQLKTKGKAEFSFDKKYAGYFTNFTDKALTIEILVDEDEQARRLTMISPDQNRKIHALFRNIAKHIGENEENTKEILKSLYCYEKEIEMFSFGDCSSELASNFIDWLITWCFENGVPLDEKPKEYFDDIERYIAVCINSAVCVVCGQPGNIEHFNNNKTCLCYRHNEEAENIGWERFMFKYHLGG